MDYKNTLDFAKKMDAEDPLASYRSQFHIPKKNGEEVLYFCGNSQGLQPKSTKAAVNQDLDDWANLGVEGHFQAKEPWYSYHEIFRNPISKLVGAQAQEVTVMNALTVNLNLLMVTFYQPTSSRFKIIYEDSIFPSDHYMMESHIRYHGFDPEDAFVELKPRSGEHVLRTDDIIKTIEETGDELALILLGGVNYYTGQAFDMKEITKAGHHAGAKVGFDLAHAIGNIQLQLHDWNVDFAAWCTYKYLNSGPGSVGGAFIHEKHVTDVSLPRFTGWWGNDPVSRFKMEKGFVPVESADGWQMSNVPILSMAAHKASLDIFDEVGMDALCAKRDLLTGYLEFILKDAFKNREMTIITPEDRDERGCQISVVVARNGKAKFDELMKANVVLDWREPCVLRMAPVPMYNSFQDIYKFGQILAKVLKKVNYQESQSV